MQRRTEASLCTSTRGKPMATNDYWLFNMLPPLKAPTLVLETLPTTRDSAAETRPTREDKLLDTQETELMY
ncbi:unnamed protein product [Dibothriocephalus latus]|uniref:Uncharacterized protein n=1 Tax=Dibothriocephalus latus TaxID=60516 RepID=A0A3P6QH37_DIBLA|nr:unnamed protein product [Dibothriocephalus latus]